VGKEDPQLGERSGGNQPPTLLFERTMVKRKTPKKIKPSVNEPRPQTITCNLCKMATRRKVLNKSLVKESSAITSNAARLRRHKT